MDPDVCLGIHFWECLQKYSWYYKWYSNYYVTCKVIYCLQTASKQKSCLNSVKGCARLQITRSALVMRDDISLFAHHEKWPFKDVLAQNVGQRAYVRRKPDMAMSVSKQQECVL